MLKAGSTIQFVAAPTPNALGNFARLYTHQSNNGNLYFASKAVTVNISGNLLGTTTRVPFYSSSQRLADTAPILWNRIANFGFAGGSLGLFSVSGNLQTINGLSTFNAVPKSGYRVAINFNKRTLNQAVTFTGVAVTLNGTVSDTALQNDRVDGLYVDMSRLKIQGSSQLPIEEDTSTQAKRYAATFFGGKDASSVVAIDTNPIAGFRPSADLYIRSRVPNHPALWVSVRKTAVTENVLIVSANGFVAVNPQFNVSNRIPTYSSTLTLGTGPTQDSTIVFRTESAGLSHTITAKGLMGVGNSIPQAKFDMNAAAGTTPLLKIDKPKEKTMMLSNGNLGVGTTTPAFSLDIQADPVPYYQAVSVTFLNTGPFYTTARKLYPVTYFGPLETDFYVGQYTVNGQNYAWGLSTSNVNVVTDFITPGWYTPFQAGTGAHPRALVVNRFGKVMIGDVTYNTLITKDPLKSISMVVSRNILSGPYTAGVMPSWIRGTGAYPYTHAFVTQQGNYFNAFGLLNRPSSVVTANRYDPIFVWGNTLDHGLVFASNAPNSTDILRLGVSSTLDPRVGLAHTNPQANLHINSSALDSTVVRVDTLSTTNALVMLNNGNWGIASSNPTQMLSVNGVASMNSIVNAPIFGTVFNTIDFRVRNSGVGVTLNTTTLRTGESVRFDINTERDQSLTGVSSVLIKPYVAGANKTGYFYGLKVDLREARTTPDPEFLNNDPGVKIAASFLGGAVGIGKVPTSDLLVLSGVYNRTTPLLQVAAFSNNIGPNYTTVLRPTGNVALFNSNLSAPSKFDIRSYGIVSPNSTAVKNVISLATLQPNAFRVGHFTEADSKLIWNDLWNKHAINHNNYQLQNYTGTFNIGTYDPINSAPNLNGLTAYPGGTQGNSGDNLDLIRSVLRQSLQKAVYGFSVTDPTTLISSQPATGNLFLSTGIMWDKHDVNKLNMNVGFVGIGYDKPRDGFDMPLSVNGDVRLGILTDATTSGVAGVGKKLFFSGGSVMGSNLDSDNTDTITIGRYNENSDQSELRISVGESQVNNPASKFVIGRSLPDHTMDQSSHLLVAKVSGYSDPVNLENGTIVPPLLRAYVGISTSNPISSLYMYGNKAMASGTPTPGAHVVILQNNGAGNSSSPVNTLAVKLANSKTDVSTLIGFLGSTTTGTGSTLPEIHKAKNYLGGIRISGSGGEVGAEFLSSPADYAEYILKENPKDTFEKGQVVGIRGGRVSHITEGADTLMVISYAPIVAGNMPPKGKEHLYALVAFMGQVPVKVRGPVQAGDYIVASGLNDGFAVAVPSGSIESNSIDLIVGQAWESQTSQAEKTVNTFVGHPFKTKVLAQHFEQAAQLQSQVVSMKQDNQMLKQKYQKTLDDREQLIKKLRQQVEELKQKKQQSLSLTTL